MTIERRIIRLLLVISLLIVVLGAWFSGEQFLDARTFHRWSTESGCLRGGFVNWCSPESRAEASEFAAMHRKASMQYAGVTITFVVALWAMFYALRWVAEGFQGSKRGRR